MDVKVNFNEEAYLKAMASYKMYKTAVQNLNQEAKVLNVTVSLKELEESGNPFTLIATKHFETLGVELPSINPVKYLQMTDIDTSALSKASNEYLKVRQFKSMPTKDQFTTTLSGEAAEQYKKWEKISGQLQQWYDEGLIDNPLAVSRAMRSKVLMGNDLKFRPAIIKTR